MVSFTGSTRAGALISHNAADDFKRVGLELGGKCANIIFADADEKAVKRGVRHCFNNTGQSCNAPTRMLVERSIYDQAVEIAKETGAFAVSHGATGKGNDQVRFELGAYALDPDIRVIAPWREWDLSSRESLMDFCEKHQIPVDYKRGSKSPYSMDANLLHISYEGGGLEDPSSPADEDMWRWTVAPEAAPDKAEIIELTYKAGDPVALNGKALSAAEMLRELNRLGGIHGVGRSDIVENRMVGMKSRGCYETPAGTIMLKAHRAIESLTLDREAAHLKDELMPKYAELIYNGYWFSPEREMLQAAIDKSQEMVTGTVRLKLYKGNATVVGRSSPYSLYSQEHVTFEEDEVYNQADAGEFININALRLRLLNDRDRKARNNS